MDESTTQTLAPSSLPALAAVMRMYACTAHMELLQTLFKHDPPVPMYEVANGSIQEEASSALHVLEDIGDRLRRLHRAYGEWVNFDASAYFDLTHAQTNRLVHVSERVSTVHVTFYADLLLPSFHKAEQCWYDEYCPAYLRMLYELQNGADPAQAVGVFTGVIQPAMTELWHSLQRVVEETNAAIVCYSDYLVAYLNRDESMRWQHIWRQKPARAIDSALLPELRSLNTLTLSTEFPLPASRQPGRIRRLRAESCSRTTARAHATQPV